MAERLAWARTHGIRPPEFVIASARVAGFDLNWIADKNRLRSQRAGRTCCRDDDRERAAACCQERIAATTANAVRPCCVPPERIEDESTIGRSGRVLGWQALKCRGQTQNWLPGVPPLIASRCALSHEMPRVLWLGPISSERADSTSLIPAIPPPESA
jgi:hypothetical protein